MTRVKLWRFLLWIALAVVGAAPAHAAGPFKNVPAGALHQPSGVVFPARVGNFQRQGAPHLYDNAGRDVSFRYLLGRATVADAYVYPVTKVTGGLDAEFRTQQNAITQVNRNVKLRAQQNTAIVQSGRRVAGKHASYDFERALQTKRFQKAGSQLYVFRDGNWFVAYRFSYPRENTAAALQQINAFLAGWQWKPGAMRI